METKIKKPVRKHKDGLEELNQTNWPVVLGILGVMLALIIAAYIVM